MNKKLTPRHSARWHRGWHVAACAPAGLAPAAAPHAHGQPRFFFLATMQDEMYGYNYKVIALAITFRKREALPRPASTIRAFTPHAHDK